ncbi:MAG TPA: hypothetical protein VMB21_03730 [Candidatus Limnocylindria bacterium]|nr:hypothetical protein [Candidatus Limnocylindria bacterium]
MNQRPFHWLKLRRLPFWRVGASRPDSAEFGRLFEQVGAAAGALKKSEAGLEAQFLTIGTELERMAGCGHEFVTQVEKLVGLATGKDCDSSVFDNPVGLIGRSTEFLEECQRRTDALVTLLRVYRNQIRELLGTEAALGRTMLPLRFVQVLFKVECAPLSADIQQLFSSLTDEIENLQGQMRDIFGTNFQKLEQTRESLEQVIGQLERQESSLRAALAMHKSRIGETLAGLRRELDSNQQREVQLNHLSRAVAREVEQVVISLQFQDIVHQKLQHVTAELPRMQARLSEFVGAPQKDALSEPMQYLSQSCRLQGGQIEAAREELLRAEAGIKGGIGNVLGHLRELDSRCLSLEEFQLLTTSGDGMVQVLVETLEEVRKLMGESVACAATAHEMLRPLGGLASNLTVIARELAARIHLFGLNAQVQAAQVANGAQGAGLAILSQRTSEICGETNRISEQAAEQLDAMAAGLAKCVREFGTLRSEAAAQESALGQESLAQERVLHAFRDHGLETLRAIGGSLDGIREHAHQTLESVQFADFCQAVLPGLQKPLRSIADSANRWLEVRGCTVKDAHLIEGLKKDYTMASEREVFERLTSSGGLLPDSPNPPPRSAEEFELFDVLPTSMDGPEASRRDTREAVTPVMPGESAANVELF